MCNRVVYSNATYKWKSLATETKKVTSNISFEFSSISNTDSTTKVPYFEIFSSTD